MVGYTAVGKILNSTTKGIIGYKLENDKNESLYYKTKDIITLAKKSLITNLDVDNNNHIVEGKAANLDNYYSTDSGILSQEEYDDKYGFYVKEDVTSNIEVEMEYQHKGIQVVNVTCDNGEYEIKLKVFDNKDDSILKNLDMVLDEYKGQWKEDKFKGYYLEVSCNDIDLEGVMSVLEYSEVVDELALLLYIEDDEYLGNYIESERRVEWLSKNKPDSVWDENVCIRLQEICCMLLNK